MFNSQDFNLLSQSMPTVLNVQQRQVAERKTLPSFINDNPEKEKNVSNLNLTFTFVPTAKHFEEEPLPAQSQNSKQGSQYQKIAKSYVIKPKIKKGNKKKGGRKASKKSSKSSITLSNAQSKQSCDVIKEESSQTSVDESDDDNANTNASHILQQESVDISRNELSKIDLCDKENLNFEELNNGENINVVMYKIKIVKLVDTETNAPYALFTIEGDNTVNVLHYDSRILNKDLLYMLSSGEFFKCKLLQMSIEEKSVRLFKRNIISFSLIDIIKS